MNELVRCLLLALVSIGGGSATGLAKAVALTTGLPITAVPTTLAGSEATPVWGMVDDGVKTTGIDERVLGGRVGGMLEFRSQVLDPTQAELGRIALGLGTSFNAGHAQGMDLYGNMGGDFFQIPAPAVNAHAANGGGAQVTASIADLGAAEEVMTTVSHGSD